MQRGVQSFKCTKVKAHLPRQAIGEGKISARDWAGNFIADTVADQAAAYKAAWHETVSQRILRRKLKLQALVTAIQHMVVNIMLEASQ
eukprot:3083528-Alexandrium_andersonii.AAC.1